MAYLRLAAAPGAVSPPAAAVVHLPAVSCTSGGAPAPFLAVFLRLNVGSPSMPGIFLAIPPASSGSPFLAFGVNLAAEATGGAAASAFARVLGPIPAGLNMSSGVPAASTSASAFARLDRDTAAVKGSRLPAAPLRPRQAERYGRATGEVGAGSFLGLEAPAETRGSGAAISPLHRAIHSDSRQPAVAEAPGDAGGTEADVKAKEPGNASMPPSRPILAKTLMDLNGDCLVQVLLRLSHKELLCAMLSCKTLYTLTSGQLFHQMYLQTLHQSPASLLCLFHSETLETVASCLQDPIPASLEFLADKHLWRIIDSRDGLLLMEPKFGGEKFLVCNPLSGNRVDIPAPEEIPPLYNLLAAGIVPEGSTSWSIIALFGTTVKSVSRTSERCLVLAYSSRHKSWDGKHQQVECELPACRMGIKPPSVLSEGFWNILVFNKNIISVELATLELTCRKLPFDHICPHILGRHSDGKLCLIFHDSKDLVLLSYDKSSAPTEWMRYPGFAFHMNSSFAEKNCLLLLDSLLCFDIEHGNVQLPFMVDLDIRIDNIVPYEMAWPPKPRLDNDDFPC